MLFMNEYEILTACQQHAGHPVLSRATRFLRQHMEEVNSNSDGWPYWSAPVRSARQLMQMIQTPETATDAVLSKALTPIKSFYTRHGQRYGMKLPSLS